MDRNPSVCTPKTKSNADYLTYFSESEKQECKYFEQIAQSMNDVLQFCVDIEGSYWFGGAETGLQEWPLNKLNWTDRSYVTKKADHQAVSNNNNNYYVIENIQTKFVMVLFNLSTEFYL